MFRRTVSKTCPNVSACDVAKNHEILPTSLNLCEQCGSKLSSRTVLDTKRLAVAGIVVVLVAVTGSYATFVWVRARLIRLATDTAVAQLNAVYDSAAAENVKTRVTDWIQSHGHSTADVADIVQALQNEASTALASPEFVSQVAGAAGAAANATDLAQRLDALAAGWSQRTGVKQSAFKEKADSIVAARRERDQMLTGGISAATHDATQGVQQLEATLQKDPDNPWVLANLCAAYLQAGRSADAVRACQRSTAESPSNWLAHYNLACAFGQLGNRDQAVEELKQTLGHAGDDPARSISRTDLVARIDGDPMLAATRQDERVAKLLHN